jgi:hypothetical protein
MLPTMPAMSRWPLMLLVVLGSVSLDALMAGEPPAKKPATVVVPLQAPLTTVVRMPGEIPAGLAQLRATVTVPEDAPEDLGVGAFVSDRHGCWYQCFHPGVLAPGRHDLDFALGAGAALMSEPNRAAWDSSASVRTGQAGLFFWSASAARSVLRVEFLPPEPEDASESGNEDLHQLRDLRLDGLDDQQGVARGVTGGRWTLSLRPDPFPVNPYDADDFALDAVFTAADGSELRVPGFCQQPVQLRDRGDRQESVPSGPPRFVVRFRPREPGRYALRLEAHWRDGGTCACQLPALEVGGGHWDDYVRVDREDKRFFAIDGEFYWPVGHNLHSTYDTRSRDRLSTVLTPERGSLAYGARFQRLAAAGGTACEIWMGSWNLALEWRRDWPGYGGLRRYNELNAAKLDAILDAAYANGIRINLTLNNHGQASPNSDREWKDNPYNEAQGGPLKEPYELFTSPVAAAGQANLRRYLVARYADHPAILGWKLWSEVNLTAAGDSQRQRQGPGMSAPVTTEERRATLARWHEQAAAHLHAIDIYHHAITTHWSGDYRKPDRNVVKLPGIDYVCIDAYHGNRGGGDRSSASLADLIYLGTQDPDNGLGAFGKPLLVTEFGATSQAGPEPQLRAELASAAWAGMCSGNAGMPMMWWFEWIDQKDHWLPFTAITRFLHGEDLRGAKAHAVVLAGSSAAGGLWVRAWTRPGRMLGYIADEEWAANGTREVPHAQAQIVIGSDVAAGMCRVEWWNADDGKLIATVSFTHPGGMLRLSPPSFVRHLAFKLRRD